MYRTTRSHTIAGHLTSGAHPPVLTWDEQQAGDPGQHEHDGFAVRQHTDENARRCRGRNWLRTLTEISGRVELPHLKCTVVAEAPGVGDHEALVRWATPQELQDRKRAQAERQAPLVALLRQQDAAAKTAAERQALEDAGQTGLF
ncbi:hypothetical protein [Streptomyces sioyaensis]|uniref:hypothetical protein n=1 Tax=Streptomyces sioyaensis TaxID=67364 RepID=UPI003EB978F7